MKCMILSLLLILTGCQSQSLKKDSATKIIVHGHRGSRGTHPENTIPAFAEAIAAKADVLEMDLHLTKDNQIVLSHDARIPSALCLDKNGKPFEKGPYIRELTLKQVKAYDCGAVKNPRFSEQSPVPGTRMPTLVEVFEWAQTNAPAVQFNIETKMDAEDKKLNPDPAFFSKTAINLFRKYKVTDRVILQSFDFSTLQEARKLEPGLRLSALFLSEKSFCDETIKLGFPIASPNHDLLSAEQMEKCKKAGVQVAPWTLNDEAAWKRAIDLGVDAIITDYPRKLRAYLSL